MTNRLFRTVPILTLVLICVGTVAKAQSSKRFADSIRMAFNIPELNYAVVSSAGVMEMEALGFKKHHTNNKAALSDQFRIGSNTKTVTSYLAFGMVKKGIIQWDTKFFDLYPELKSQSNKAYHHLTLKDLLTMRARLMSWTYTYTEPTQQQIKGTEQQQRYAFLSWIMRQPPLAGNRTYYFSNPSYVAAGMMLEKVSGKDYKTLVQDLGKELAIEFGFGQPNFKDINQPWGHNADLEPEKPSDNYKLNWLSSAGNINVSLQDYVKFIQLQLLGLAGKSSLLSAEEFYTMYFGLPQFAYGWNWYVDEESKMKYAWHTGNPGSFFTKVYVCKETDKAFIFFANVGSEQVENGINLLFEHLKKKYSKRL
ncbi:MAG: serine hydrolase [Chitinophagaceae bacterium]|jgi:CubicO group peptidase (beta-lactamase class C family)